MDCANIWHTERPRDPVCPGCGEREPARIVWRVWVFELDGSINLTLHRVNVRPALVAAWEVTHVWHWNNWPEIMQDALALEEHTCDRP